MENAAAIKLSHFLWLSLRLRQVTSEAWYSLWKKPLLGSESSHFLPSAMAVTAVYKIVGAIEFQCFARLQDSDKLLTVRVCLALLINK